MKELISFVLSLAVVLVLGYCVIAPMAAKDAKISKIQDLSYEEQEAIYKRIEENWAKEYDIYSPLK